MQEEAQECVDSKHRGKQQVQEKSQGMRKSEHMREGGHQKEQIQGNEPRV